MFISVITKNLNWEILTKNLVMFKRWDGVKDKKWKTLISWAFTEKSSFYGGVHEKPIYRGELSKKVGDLNILQIEGATWWKRGGGISEGDVDTPMHTLRWQHCQGAARKFGDWERVPINVKQETSQKKIMPEQAITSLQNQ